VSKFLQHPRPNMNEKLTVKINKIRATDVSQLFYFLLFCATSTNYNVHTSALDGAGKSQTEYFDTNYKLILTPPLIKII
jgi:hypothetical protein